MRRLIVSTFVSLDGIMQAPGGPEEDPTGGFTLGGWLFNYWDEGMDASASGFDGKDRELVLGRRTYQIFEAYWPYQPEDDPTARTLNAAKKHVASRTLTTLHWNNSTLLHGDVVSAITALKAQPGPDLQMIGSGNLIQTLQAASLIDEYNVWTFPVVLGRGKRLFGETAKPVALRLVRSQVSTTGVVMSTYVPGGDLRPGSFARAEPSEKELARRRKMANEMTLQRMDNVLIVVDDLEAAKAFFVELGMELEGEMPVEGRWVDRIVGLENVRCEIAMMRTPDGHGRIELDKFHAPAAVRGEPKNPPVNTLGIRRIMFAVADIEDALARLRAHGAELIGEVVQYEDMYRLCYIRGPEGIIVALAEQLG